MRIVLVILFFPFCLIGQTYNAEILEFNTYAYIKPFEISFREHRKIRINNRSGLKFAKISIPYSSNNIKNLEAGIYDSQGQLIRRLKKKDKMVRSDISDISLYEDSYVVEFELIHNIFPYIVQYSYETEVSEFIEAVDWIPVVAFHIPTLHAELTVEKSDDIALRTKTFNFESSSTSKWITNYINLVENETLSVDPREKLPRVLITTEKFKYEEEGGLKSWTDFGMWVSKLNEGLSDLPQSEIYTAKSVVKNVTDPREKIKKLYEYLQKKTRYINISIESGGFKPYPASYVAENGYGDCKALTNYFKSLLEEVDIPSYYSLVYADDKISTIDFNFPNQEFNHAILMVPMENDTIWLDCTSDGPFNYLGTFTQNRPVFVVNGEKSSFVKSPALTMEEVKEEINYQYHIDIKGVTRLIEDQNMRGPSFETLNWVKSQLSNRDNQYIINRYFKQNEFEVEKYQFSGNDENPQALNLHIEQRSESFLKNFGSEYIVDLFKTEIPSLEPVEERKLDLQLNYPIHRIINHTVHLNPDMVTEWMPADWQLNSEYGYYERKVEKSDNRIEVFIRMQIKSGDILLDNYEDFFQFISAIKNSEKELKLILK